MSDRGVILSIGSFDGVHAGHQAILARARQLAQQTGLKVLAMTFDPHPAWTLRPGSEPPLLTGLAQKIERLRAAGADEVVVIEPTPAILGQTAWQFIESLAKQYPVAGIVEGEDFRFGKGRAGDMALLKQW
ncbi:MAG TPA: adenylyltransferase/cytidyltransferase family protein, partial [Phycisphaeraceae bacterium]